MGHLGFSGSLQPIYELVQGRLPNQLDLKPGNWSHDDHDTFLRVFRKFKQNTGVKFLTEVQQIVENGDAFFPRYKKEFEIREKIVTENEFILRRWVRK